ncbi:MAG: M20/M25/M40 family metallo-hydrolase [Phycisphaerales bacterium]|jgi:acetylornithine deacetylase|nr:M20/M25/M40 family metallo-hydrolase [Phycisphaerales bacterium]
MPQGEKIAHLLSEMVRIPSVTPAQAGPRSGTPGEAKMTQWVTQQLQSLGAQVHHQEVLPGRHNVFGLFHGQSNKWLGVDVHMDTVGVEQMQGDPFDGRIENDRVYGRGSVDTKATLAVCLNLLQNHPNKPLPHNLLIAATCDEEDAARGASAMARWLKDRNMVIDELAVAEPTLCAPIHGHKGVMRQKYRIQGVAAHSSRPELGKNTITAAAKLALAFDAENHRLNQLTPTPLGHGTLTVTTIHGGVGINVVPDATEFTIDRRVVPGESAEKLADQCLQLARRSTELPVEAENYLMIDAFYRPTQDDFIQRMAQWSGQSPATVPYCTNAWAYTPATARQCLIIGPGSIDQAHGAVEWVEIAQLQKLSDLYTRWWEIKP